MTSWMSIRSQLYAGGFFDKIVTRKLIYEMTTERLNDLDQFRRNSVGHAYGLKPSKVLFSQRSEPNISGKHSEISHEREFFCSELIAKAFKVLGVMKNPNSKSSTNYYPGCFAPRELGGVIDNEMASDVALGPALNILVDTRHDLNRDTMLQGMHPMSGHSIPRTSNASQRYNCWV